MHLQPLKKKKKERERGRERSTVNTPDDFRDRARCWGTYEDAAPLVMQNQWDNLLRHIMEITAAMEVCDPSASSSSAAGEIHGAGGDPQNASEVEGNTGT